jgi:hypothetical protein
MMDEGAGGNEWMSCRGEERRGEERSGAIWRKCGELPEWKSGV